MERQRRKRAWDLEIGETGLYTVGIRYLPHYSGKDKIEMQLKVDFNLPFDEAGRLSLDKPWKDINDENIYDQRGNEIQEISELWIGTDFKNKEGFLQ